MHEPARARRTTARPSTPLAPPGSSLGPTPRQRQGDLALYHAERCSQLVTATGLEDFDLVYAHEARARALACLGRLDEAAAELDAARAVPVVDPEDRAIVDADLAVGPWFGLAVA